MVCCIEVKNLLKIFDSRGMWNLFTIVSKFWYQTNWITQQRQLWMYVVKGNNEHWRSLAQCNNNNHKEEFTEQMVKTFGSKNIADFPVCLLPLTASTLKTT